MRGHAAGEDAADVGVVGAGGDVEDYLVAGPSGLDGKGVSRVEGVQGGGLEEG